MIVDYGEPTAPKTFKSELCIIGAGPAGITMALELAKAGRPSLLLESGGYTPEVATQSLYQGENIGRSYFPLDGTRLRALGGSSGHWSGWCGTLNENDFLERPWIPYSGWPISKSTLDPYYARAQEYLELGPYRYDAGFWSKEYSDFPDFEPDNLLARFWQFSAPPVRFAQKYRAALEKSELITLVLHCNVLQIEINENGDYARSIEIGSLSGRSGSVVASNYIVACGGIENARLLLASNKGNPAGVGNDNGLVGKFFMEHPEVDCGRIYSFDASQMKALKRLETRGGTEIGMAFCSSPKQQQKMKIGNGAGFIAAPRVSFEGNGWAAFMSIRKNLSQGRIPENFYAKLRDFMIDFDTFAGMFGLWLRKISYSTQIIQKGSIRVISMCEQVPNPDSRVVLSREKDKFGNPLANLDWRLSDLDRRTVRQTMVLIAAEMNRLGMGRLEIDKWLRNENGTNWSPDVRGGHHHMGTTRMASSPNWGVVNEDCRVFEISNLFIAGSSVFPTGGYVNPTLTILALALRLTDHLMSSS